MWDATVSLLTVQLSCFYCKCAYVPYLETALKNNVSIIVLGCVRTAQEKKKAASHYGSDRFSVCLLTECGYEGEVGRRRGGQL